MSHSDGFRTSFTRAAPVRRLGDQRLSYALEVASCYRGQPS